MNYPLARPLSAFILSGGASRRMGSDKALLLFKGKPLLVHLASVVHTLTPALTVIAPSGRYESLGFSTLPDIRPGCGPLSGIETALTHSPADWSLILACDLPHLTPAWLETLVSSALSSPEQQIIASGDPPNPLAAVWHKSALPAVHDALNTGNFRVRDLLSTLSSKILIPQDPQILANWNRPEDIEQLGG